MSSFMSPFCFATALEESKGILLYVLTKLILQDFSEEKVKWLLR